MTSFVESTPARQLRDAVEPLAMVYVHPEEAREEYEAIGLDWWQGYLLGRAATMGTPPTTLVIAAFGAFSPELLTRTYEAARAKASTADVLAARERAATRTLHRVLGEPGPDVDETVATLRPGIEAADLLGKPLFAGHRSLAWPADPWGRLWHAVNTLRELRGDAHIAALVAAAIGPLASNILTEAHVGLDTRDYTRTRDWSETQIDAAVADLVDRGILGNDGALTERGVRVRTDIEKSTETALDPVVEAIGPAMGDVLERCGRWSASVVEAGAFPDDPFKRAAG